MQPLTSMFDSRLYIWGPVSTVLRLPPGVLGRSLRVRGLCDEAQGALMQSSTLDRRAVLRRLVQKLRADCEYFGTDPERVRRMTIEQLLAERRRRLKDLIEGTPEPRAAVTTWDV